MQDKKKLYRTISIVSLLVMLIAILALVWIFLHISQSRQQYLDLSQMVRLDRKSDQGQSEEPAAEETVPPEPSPTAEPTPDPEPSPSPEPALAEPEILEEIPIDFAYLDQVNKDIIAWIQVEGTTVDYPVLFDQTKERC